MISAHELVRASDVSSSHEAARIAVKHSVARELAAVATALALFNSSTSKELAALTERIGREDLGQTPEEWRTTCARRLPTGEDQGIFEATCPSPSKSRPMRAVDVAIKPCAISGIRSIRWNVKRGE